MADITIAELIEQLRQRPPTDKVRAWLPGQHIALSPAMIAYKPGVTLIEGNVIDPKDL